MADENEMDPAANQQGDPQGVGERMVSLETQIANLVTLVGNQQQMLASMVETQQRERVESSGSGGAAPRGIGPESGVHQSGATGRTATSTGGDTLGFGVSGVRVGRGVVDQGLNPMYQMRIVPLFLQLTLVRLTGLLVGL